MPRSDPGSETARVLRPSPWPTCRRAGRHWFTLIELMVVVAIIAIAAGVASLALRDPASTQLEREAARLSALLEAARAEARGLGLRVVWRPSTGVDVAINPADPHPAQFEFVGLPKASVLPRHWLNPAVRADVQGARWCCSGPNP